MHSLCSLSRLQTKTDTLKIKPPSMNLWGENHLSEGQKKSTRQLCLMLSRPSLTAYSIAGIAPGVSRLLATSGANF
jgi:hypothetical protein